MMRVSHPDLLLELRWQGCQHVRVQLSHRQQGGVGKQCTKRLSGDGGGRGGGRRQQGRAGCCAADVSKVVTGAQETDATGALAASAVAEGFVGAAGCALRKAPGNLLLCHVSTDTARDSLSALCPRTVAADRSCWARILPTPSPTTSPR